MVANMSAVSKENCVPGQVVLPGFEEILEVESSVLKKPEQERFCWAYVTNGGKTGQAYQKAINPQSDLLNAQKRASELLKKPEICGRIKQIAAIIQRKYEHEVIGSAVRDLHRDPKAYFDAQGKPKAVVDMDDVDRMGLGLEARIVDGRLIYLPVFPSPEKARSDLAKMFGMEKTRAEISAPGGGPIQHEHVVTDDLGKLDNLRAKLRKAADEREACPS